MINTQYIKPFGTSAAGEDVSLITLDNGIISCGVISFGAALQSLIVKDRAGQPVDVVLGYDTLREYEQTDGYLGATVGRCANRIAKGHLEINGRTYALAINNGENHLHGGLVGFSHRVWQVEDVAADSVTLSLESPDGEENYPGNMRVKVCYSLQGNALHIDYWALSDADTVCSLTNHSYFNLAGHASGDALSQEIMIHASRYTPTDAGSIPTGELTSVESTPMDLRAFTPLGKYIDSDFIQLVQGRGYDHNYVIDGEFGTLRPAAAARCSETGIEMRLESTLPGLQLYSANYVEEGRQGKAGAVYGPRHAFCFETQFFPDSPNQPQFPSPLLRAGEEYRHKAVFNFSNFD